MFTRGVGEFRAEPVQVGLSLVGLFPGDRRCLLGRAQVSRHTVSLGSRVGELGLETAAVPQGSLGLRDLCGQIGHLGGQTGEVASLRDGLVRGGVHGQRRVLRLRVPALPLRRFAPVPACATSSGDTSASQATAGCGVSG